MKISLKWKLIVTSFLLLGLIIWSLQHRLEYQIYSWDQTWTIQDDESNQPIEITIEEIRVEKFYDEIPVTFEVPWYMKLFSKTPTVLHPFIYRFGHFFSLPHQFEYGSVKFNGVIQGDTSITKNYRIEMNTNIYFSTGGYGKTIRDEDPEFY